MSKTTGIAEQILSLPKGSGTIQGLGESFKPDLHMGTGVYNIPIDIPNGPNDISPPLNLSYNTASGNGFFGMGFSLNLPCIYRSTNKTIPQYTDDDSLYLEGSGKIIKTSDGRFSVETSPFDWQIQSLEEGFLLTDKNGLYYKLGLTDNSKIFKRQNNITKTFKWLLEEIEDAYGNKVFFEYLRDGENLYIKKIEYGIYSIEFNYEQREDTIMNSNAGFSIFTNLRCRSIQLNIMEKEKSLLREWSFHYKEGLIGKHSLLHKIILTGYDKNGEIQTLPVLTLDYTSFNKVQLEKFTGETPGILPTSYTDGKKELVDFTGNGLPDLLEINNNNVRLWENKGNCVWKRPSYKSRLPIPVDLASNSIAFADMEGNGTSDIIFLDRPLAGYYPHLLGGGFDKPIFWENSPNANLADSNTKLIDLNNDGITDLLTVSDNFFTLYYRNKKNGWENRPITKTRNLFPSVDISDRQTFFADMTGDGLQDIVRVDGSGVSFWPYLGNGVWGNKIKFKNSYILPLNFNPDRLFLADIDGDGCSDIIYVANDKVIYWINTGGSFLSNPVEIPYTLRGTPNDIRIADMKGTGTVGVLWAYDTTFSKNTDYFFLDISGSQKPYLLNSIDNGMGLKTSIKYSVSTLERERDGLAGQHWNTFLPFPVQVVSSISSFDMITNTTATTKYKYHNGHYDGIEGIFSGFKIVDILEEGDESTPSMLTKNWHHLGCDESEPLKHMPYEKKILLNSLIGKVLKVEVFAINNDEDLHLHYRTINKWNSQSILTDNNTKVVHAFLEETKTMYFDRDNSPYRISTLTNLQYDQYGNILLQEQKAINPSDALSEKKLLTNVSYAFHNEKRFVNKPSRVVQTDKNGNIVSLTIRYYDNLPEGEMGNKGVVTNQEFLALTENLVQEVYKNDVPDFLSLGYHKKDGESGWWTFGKSYEIKNIEGVYTGKVINTFGDITKIFFDSNRIYPEKIIDAMGNETSASYDFRANKISLITDTNGASIKQTYDSLGRVRSCIEPGACEEFPTESYTYVTDSLPLYILHEKRLENGKHNTLKKKFFLDGHGRIIEERTINSDHEFIEKSIVFSNRNLVKKHYLPHISQSSNYQIDKSQYHMKIEYDALGRPIKTTNPDGSFKKLVFSKENVIVYDEEDTRNDQDALHKDTPVTNTYDCTGRICKVTLNLNGRLISTFYNYDIKGNLTEVLEPEGKKSNFTFDLSGNPIKIVNSAIKNLSFVYDAIGNRVERRNNSSEKTFFEYDSLGRIKEVTQSNAPDKMSQYFYNDTNNSVPDSFDYSLGRASNIKHKGGEETYSYDDLGRIVRKTSYPKNLNGKSLCFDYEYRADGQISSVTYPAFYEGQGRLKLLYKYDNKGRLTGIPGYIKKIEYNLLGQRTLVHYNNGIKTLYTYDEKTLLLKSCIKKDSFDNILEDFIYFYDKTGNIIKIQSSDEKLSTNYSYDNLYRLTKAENLLGDRWLYNYNDVSDLTFKSDIGELLYDSSGQLVKAGDDSYVFDNSGRLKSSPMGEFQYDSTNKLISVHGEEEQAHMAYDHQGRRISMTHTNSNNTFSILTPDELISIENNVMYLLIFDGSQCIAKLNSHNGSCVFLHQNHLGSTSKITDISGKILQSIYYDPFGAVIENIINADKDQVRIKFAGKELDFFTNLVYMSSRYYCPNLGSFITPDTVIPGVYNPLAWNQYSYVLNNPLKYVDPTGHFWKEIGSWFEDNWKTIVAAVAVVAVVTISILTFGAGLIGVGALVGVGIGMTAGGIVGGIAAHQAGGDILLGVLTGMALGGAASLAGAGIGAGMSSLLGNSLTSALLSGTLSGAVTGGAIGFAAGFAGGAGTGGQIWDKVWKGALTGAVTGFLFSFGTYGFQNGWFTGPKVSFKTPTANEFEAALANTAKSLGESQDAGSTAITFAKELGSSCINTSSGYTILNLVFSQTASPIWHAVLSSSLGGVIALDYGEDLWKLLKESEAKIKISFDF